MTTTSSQVNFEDPKPSSWPPVWMIWKNPIVRRYCYSRLRPRGLGIWLLVTLLIAGFMFFTARGVAIHQGDMEIVDAERMALIPLLIFQGIILFLLGTGQVAGGMTAESDEGVIDYQRLAPMSPLGKVLGYLFGLPIREYVMVLATMPFTIWGLWKGEVPLGISLQLYGVFFTSAILYHLTGLVAGTVVKNKRWAFLVSMAVVFLLYTVIPQLAKFGLVYFRYLTIMPVLEESWPYLIERTAGAAVRSVQNLLPKASFFDLGFPQVVFTVISQLVLILTGISMLWRRWRRAESHLLGKLWAVLVFGWVQIVLLGNALPLIEKGYLFPSRELDRFTGRFQTGGWNPQTWEAGAIVVTFGLSTLAMLWLLTLMITPSAETRLRGWRRARKLNRSWFSPFSDPATSWPWVVAMVMMGVTGWFVFAKAVIEAHWFPGQVVQPESLAAFGIVLVTGGLGFHAILEARGGRAAGLAAIFVGVVPIMVGTIVAIVNDDFPALAIWIAGISPPTGPFFASTISMGMPDVPPELYRAIPRAFWFWQVLSVVVLLRLTLGLRKSLRSTAKKAIERESLFEAAPVETET
ncbi:MAG: hypothetical protein AAGA58_10195, partial [Verrucomicrobiota bacterium]